MKLFLILFTLNNLSCKDSNKIVEQKVFKTIVSYSDTSKELKKLDLIKQNPPFDSIVFCKSLFYTEINPNSININMLVR